jgi:fructose-1,6-bisphosphatase/inositol monophosphatase family enzyme
MLVATGRAEIMIEPQLSLWDMAALPPILQEAGGTFSDWKGTPTIYTGEGLATNGRLREQVLAITRGQ